MIFFRYLWQLIKDAVQFNKLLGKLNKDLEAEASYQEKHVDTRIAIMQIRRTLGNSMWLDSLTDEEFATIRDAIIPVYENAKRYREK